MESRWYLGPMNAFFGRRSWASMRRWRWILLLSGVIFLAEYVRFHSLSKRSEGSNGAKGGALVFSVRETHDPEYLKRTALMGPRGFSGCLWTFFPVSAGAFLIVAALAGFGCTNASHLDSASDLPQSAEASPASTSSSPVRQVALTSQSPTPFVVTTPLALPQDNDRLGPVRFFVPGNPWKKNDRLRRTVPMDDFFLGSNKDGIPAILEPNFETNAQANEWLDPLEPVILLELGSDVRAYPVQILILHEIVNDVVDGQPVLVSY